jgi:cobalt-zinc-cadmium efflux system outer membrane protein
MSAWWRWTLAVFLLATGAVPASAAPQHEQHQEPQPTQPAPEGMHGMHGMVEVPAVRDPLVEPAPVDPNTPTFALDDLERRALDHNPATASAAAAIRAAEGRRLQAGLWPNPVVGYSGDDIPVEGGRHGGKNGFFVSQEVPLGGKLRLSRDVVARGLDQARIGAEGERLQLLAQVRMLFYRTLAAQTRVEVRERLAALARETVDVTGQLYNTGAADAPDHLASENEASLLQSSLASAHIELEQLWAALRAVVNDPALAAGRLRGDLTAGPPALDREEWRQKLLRESPALRIANADMARAEAALARAKAARVPDLTLNGGLRRDSDPVHPGGPAIGNEAFADIGLRLPLWDRNQGGIAAAAADLSRARLEAERMRLGLEARFAARYGRYRQAAERAAAFRGGILDRARQSYAQYLSRYQQMMAAYPQVLMAQRTLFQLEDDYVDTLDRAWESAVAIQTLQVDGGGME